MIFQRPQKALLSSTGLKVLGFMRVCDTNPYIQVIKFYEHKIVIMFLPINFNMCFGCSKELSH